MRRSLSRFSLQHERAFRRLSVGLISAGQLVTVPFAFYWLATMSSADPTWESYVQAAALCAGLVGGSHAVLFVSELRASIGRKATRRAWLLAWFIMGLMAIAIYAAGVEEGSRAGRPIAVQLGAPLLLIAPAFLTVWIAASAIETYTALSAQPQPPRDTNDES